MTGVDKGRHGRAFVLVSLVALAACAEPVVVPALDEEVNYAGEGEAIRVLSFNTWSVPFRDAHEERTARTAEVVAALSADVVLLQEVWRQQDVDVHREALAAAGLTHFFAHASDEAFARGSSGLLIASRYPIVRRAFVPFHAGDIPWWPWPVDWYATKGMLDVTLATPGGPLRVINAHLHAAYGGGGHQAERLEQTLELLARIGDPELPLVVAGDLNSLPGEPSFELLHARSHSTVRSDVDCVLGVDGAEGAVRLRNARTALTGMLDFPSGPMRLSDHAALWVEAVVVRSADVVSSAAPLTRPSSSSLLASLRRAQIHQWTGRALCALALLFVAWSVLRRRRKPRQIWMVLVALMVASWSAYHGWLLGPSQSANARAGLQQIERTMQRGP